MYKMSYFFYLDKILFPIAPSKLQLKISNKNKTINLINQGEINVLKQPGLTSITFDLLLPNVEYPFAAYKNGFKSASYFLKEIEKLKSNKKPFQFIVNRYLPNGKMLFDTNMKVSIEDYDIQEDAKNGFDVIVSIKLKQYCEYGTKTIVINNNNTSTQNTRSDETSPKPSKNNTKTHVVKSGDCLWNIAKKYYGDGSKNTVIYKANKDVIEKTAKKYGRKSSSNGHWIYPGTQLTIPAL